MSDGGPNGVDKPLQVSWREVQTVSAWHHVIENASDTRQIPAMMQKAAYECSVAMTGGRMDDKTCRFIQNQQVTVLIEDIQIHGLRQNRARLRRRLGREPGPPPPTRA